MKKFKWFLEYDGGYKDIEAPSGWETLRRQLFRDEDFNSVLFSDTLDIRFLKSGLGDVGGYQFIKDIYDNYSPNAVIKLHRQTKDTYIINKYNSDWNGVLDLADDSFNETEDFISVKTIDSVNLAKFLSRVENEIDLTSIENIDGESVTPNSDSITIPPIDFYLNTPTTGFISNLDSQSSVSFLGINSNYKSTADESSNEIGDRIIVSENPTNGKIYENTLTYRSYIYINNINGTTSDRITIQNLGNYDWNYKVKAYLRSYDESDNLIDEEIIELLSIPGSSNVYDYEVNETYTGTIGKVEVPANGYVVFFIRTELQLEIETGDITVSNSHVFNNITFVEQTEGAKATRVKGLLCENAIKQAIKMTCTPTDIVSNITRPYNDFGGIFFTTGENIRNKDKEIVTTTKDLFKAINSARPIGVWYNKKNDTFYINNVEQYYQNIYFDFICENVLNFKRSPDKNFYWNKLLGGYKNAEIDDFQGVNDYNFITEHSSPFTVKKTKDIRSPYYGSSIPVEYLRRLGNTSKDNNLDKGMFMINTDGNEVIVNGNNISGFDGISQYFNYGFLPRQNIIKHSRMIGAEFHNLQSEQIRFSSAKGYNVKYDDVNEYDNVEYDEFRNLLFKPNIINFEHYVTDEFIKELDVNPHRKLRFTNSKNEMGYGFIKILDYNLYTNKATFELRETWQI